MSLKPDGASVRKLGILAGAGRLPREVAEARRSDGKSVFIIDLEGAAAEWASGFPNERVSLGQVGRVLALLECEGCDAVTMAGGLTRPSLTKVRFDRQGLALLPRVARLFGRGDDGLLSGVADLFEEHGFPVIGAETFLPRSLAGSGVIAGSLCEQDDIALGRSILDALGPYDIGQAVVISGGRCLAVEAAEGTAAMLDRVAALRADGDRGGVLVKMLKRGQDSRVDRPAIGPDTIQAAVKAGLSGIAVEAGGVFVLDATQTEELARESGLFLYGFEP